MPLLRCNQAAFALPVPAPVVSVPEPTAPTVPAAAPVVSTSTSTTPAPSGGKRKRAAKNDETEEQVDDEDEDDDAIERNYVSGSKKQKTDEVAADDDNEEEEDVDNDEELSEIDEDIDDAEMDLGEEEGGEERLVHESLKKDGTTTAGDAKKSGKKEKPKKTKYTPPDETSEQRDSRTIFVGNLDVEVIKSNGLQRQLFSHLTSFAPNAKVESIRFRSVAFAAPTVSEAQIENKAEEEAKAAGRERQRASAWKKEHGDEPARGRKAGDEENEGKTFFKPGERRKVAFIKKDFHSTTENVNAYVVFAHPAPDRSKNVAPILDPYVAAKEIIKNGNHSQFMERTLRLDACRPSLSTIAATAAQEGKSTLPLKRQVWTAGKDPKKSLYVGNLDYAAKEEDLRAFFESLLVAERGDKLKSIDADGIESGPNVWVEDVRIIRDRDTQMGKGFGYVAFHDKESVDEVLAMKSDKLKFAKRNLRVQASKALPPSLGGRADPVVVSKPTRGGAAGASASASSSRPGGRPAVGSNKPTQRPIRQNRTIPTTMPKGDPTLGAKLASLPKDERKTIKQSDADRIARRMAKKATTVASQQVEKGKVKLDVKGTSKKLGGKSSGKGHADKAKKSRVRSENAAKKVKGKRD